MALSSGSFFSLADDSMDKMEMARELAVILGLQSFPSKLRQMSPLVYTWG